LALSGWKGKWRRRPGATGFTAVRGEAEKREEAWYGRGADMWGRPVSDSGKKKREKKGRWAAAGEVMGRWAGQAER
jgi:hypothetical protein